MPRAADTWQKQVSSEPGTKGKPYWWNTRTRETTWVEPPKLTAVAAPRKRARKAAKALPKAAARGRASISAQATRGASSSLAAAAAAQRAEAAQAAAAQAQQGVAQAARVAAATAAAASSSASGQVAMLRGAIGDGPGADYCATLLRDAGGSVHAAAGLHVLRSHQAATAGGAAAAAYAAAWGAAPPPALVISEEQIKELEGITQKNLDRDQIEALLRKAHGDVNIAINLYYGQMDKVNESLKAQGILPTGAVISAATARRLNDGSQPEEEEDDESDSDVEFIGVNQSAELCLLPHARCDCPSKKFARGDSRLNAERCSGCYCYVCDVPASDCRTWRAHCSAEARLEEWQKKRSAVKAAKAAAR